MPDAERRPRGRPVGADGAVTRARVLRGARELFSEKGYERTTTNDIATSAGLSRTSFYQYFTDKADVYRAVIEDFGERIFPELFDDDAGRPAERVARVFIESARWNAEDPSYSRFLIAMLVDGFRHEEFAGLAGDSVERTRQFFLHAAGDDADADLLLAMQWGLGLFSAFMGDQERLERAAGRLSEIIGQTLDAD